jgi:PAS domain S-box-containing protein
MKSFLNWKVRLAFGFALLTLLLMGAVSYRWMIVSNESIYWVRHTHEVISNIQDLALSIESIESATRGFVLTGKESDLDAYAANVARVAQDQTTIRGLAVDNTVYQTYIPQLKVLTAERIKRADMVIDLRRTKGFAPAMTAIASGPDERDTRFLALLDKMMDRELLLQAQRIARTDRYLSQAKTILIIGILLGILIVGFASWAAVRDSDKRAAAEESLRENEENYRMLLDGIHDYAIFMLDPEGRVVSWNAGAERVKGYTAQQIIGQNFSRFFSPEDNKAGKPNEILRVAAAKGQYEELGKRVRSDGTQFPAGVSDAALRDADGNLRGFSVVSHDLTASQYSEARYRGLLEAAPDGMVVVNQSGEIVLLNAQAEKQFGYHRNELIGQKVTNIIPEGFAERLIADGTRTAAEALVQQIGTGIELNGLRKDGSKFPLEIMLSPLESSEGILVTAAIRDITVRKDAETHLAQMEGRYRGLLEAAPDGMVVVNQTGDIVLLNAQAENQFGYRRDELLGQKVTNIIPEGFAERLVADALRTVEDALAQQIGAGIELHGLRKDGTAFPIEIMLSPLESAEGILVTMAIRNIATRKAAEKHLAMKIEELFRSNRDLEQFAAIASHDLQEPLRMVASYTQLLSRRYKGKLDSDADEFIAFAVDGATRMQQLIQDLLTYSRVASRGAELLEVSSEDALKKAIKNLGGAIQESGAVVTNDSLPNVLADESQLVQLFQNLVGNAIKYQKSGAPCVHISAVMNGNRKWMFSVKDNGLGIDPQFFERIFGMFQRLHKREEFSGTGIGLAICKKIVERHGGTISVESQPGQGSIFHFSLDAAEVNAEQKPEVLLCQ